MVRSWQRWAAALVMVLGGAASASAAPVYQFVVVPQTGDVAGLTGFADNGDVLVTSGQGCNAQPCSYIASRSGPLGPFAITRVRGLPTPSEPGGTEEHTVLSQINSRGDYLGVTDAGGAGRLNIPTLWLAGVPFDLGDPANAGLAFTPDAGVAFGLLDLSALVIANTPAGVLAGDWALYTAGTVQAWSNARGEFAFEVRVLPGQPTGLLVPLGVPEPPTLAGVLVALAALAWRGGRVGRSARPVAAAGPPASR